MAFHHVEKGSKTCYNITFLRNFQVLLDFIFFLTVKLKTQYSFYNYHHTAKPRTVKSCVTCKLCLCFSKCVPSRNQARSIALHTAFLLLFRVSITCLLRSAISAGVLFFFQRNSFSSHIACCFFATLFSMSLAPGVSLGQNSFMETSLDLLISFLTMSPPAVLNISRPGFCVVTKRAIRSSKDKALFGLCRSKINPWCIFLRRRQRKSDIIYPGNGKVKSRRTKEDDSYRMVGARASVISRSKN